ncbi:SGNH/GDSL hydrolase family protein [Aliikangiella coralliicola]|uniref:SGNH/GDSL hydrolase family protein n=1 Tax=Aliikangiella coralliicola TaxID=2592383 RepID=A0A545UA69_9GAMM|nr:GDSL-type esterase/lipase family protein [Aliikangiella coralliicola]TQV86361.1 SGNH/GDSL hydrolase family protein [Aliikangiella coralliicola]
MVNILCFGDSIVFGECDQNYGGWVDRLKKGYIEQYADSLKQEVFLYNLGIGGETTDGLVKRFSVELKARKIGKQKTLVIFAYGANDIVVHKNKNIVPANYFIRNLTDAISTAKLEDCKVLILSLLPISNTIEGKVNQHDKLRYDLDIQQYNLILEKISVETESEFLNLYSPFNQNDKESLLSGDGVHPNSKGHALVSQLVREKLIQMLPAYH